MPEKLILVLGAAGSVGNALCTELETTRYGVIRCVRNTHQQHTVQCKRSDAPFRRCWVADVLNPMHLLNLTQRLGQNDLRLDTVVYAVGHKAEEGYKGIREKSLFQLPESLYETELQIHRIGLYKIVRALLPFMDSFIILSPTKRWEISYMLTHDDQQVFVQMLRQDPEVLQDDVRIHHVGTDPFETDFFARSGIQNLIPLQRIIREIIGIIEESPADHADRLILAE